MGSSIFGAWILESAPNQVEIYVPVSSCSYGRCQRLGGQGCQSMCNLNITVTLASTQDSITAD